MSQAEHNDRIRRIKAIMTSRGLDVLVLSAQVSVDYIAGFPHFPSGRPMFAVLQVDAEPVLLVPKLEYLYALERAFVKDVRLLYFDIPSAKPILEALSQALKGLELDRSRIGVENTFDIAVLEKFMPEAKFHSAADIVIEMRMVKSKMEVDLIRKACEFSDRGMEIFREIARPGISELEAEIEANHRLSQEVVRKLPEIEIQKSLVYTRFQAGPRAAYHGFSSNRRVKKGDTAWFVVRGRSPLGYESYAARISFLGDPGVKERRLYAVILDAWKVGLEAVKPGVKCCDVEEAASSVIKQAGYGEFIQRRLGYGIGLTGREDPYLTKGDSRILQPGMTFAFCPGLYVPDYGAFRCEDTVLITSKGFELLTEAERDLKSRIIK